MMGSPIRTLGLPLGRDVNDPEEFPADETLHATGAIGEVFPDYLGERFSHASVS